MPTTGRASASSDRPIALMKALRRNSEKSASPYDVSPFRMPSVMEIPVGVVGSSSMRNRGASETRSGSSGKLRCGRASIIDNTAHAKRRLRADRRSSMTAPLRVGLVGAGWVTQHHLAGWSRLGARAKVVAIADPDATAASARAAAFGIAQTFTSAAQMLDGAGLDAVDVAAPREFHAEIVRMAADRGLAVL